MSDEKIAFKMALNPGMADEYRRRRDDSWPELEAPLREAGIRRDCSIHLDERTRTARSVYSCPDSSLVGVAPVNVERNARALASRPKRSGCTGACPVPGMAKR